MEANLALYRHHQVAARLLFWFPTSILFFLSKVDLSTTLRLSAVYFLTVVVAEVPSGWLSDRWSRVGTLRLGAFWWIAAYGFFLLSGRSVALLVVAQMLVGLGFAFLSGTDSALHYDSLEALGRSEEFERSEANVGRNAFLATTIAAVVGGLLGLIDLRLPFAASLVAAVWQLTIAVRFAEPPRPVTAHEHPEARAGQLAKTARYLRRPSLAWVFLFLTVQQPLEGLALDLVQPWLSVLLGDSLSDAGAAPLYSGLLVAGISLVGALASARAPQLRRVFGLRGALGLLAAIEVAILIGLALVVSPLLVPLLLLRSTQAAAAPVLVAAGTARHLAKDHRATFLSMGSLAGRLAYGACLIGLSGFDEDFDLVRSVAAVGGVVALVLLGVAAMVAGPNDL